jgi:glutamine synthetase
MPDPVAMTQLEVPDYDLGIRGKMVRASKTHGSTNLAMCTIVYGLSVTDEVTDTQFSSADNGYPDARLVPDQDTRVELSWRPGTDAVIADLYDVDGRPVEMSPRYALRRVLDGYADLDLAPVLGFEYELWLFYDGPGQTGPQRRPFGTTENAYSVSRSAEVHALTTDFINRMESVGVTVEMFHSELGPGFFEFTLAPSPALQATDSAVRARQYLRDLCVEHGLHASFMAKPFADKSGAGGHVHSSLNRAGANIFCTRPGQLSPEAEHYLAGLLVGMADTTVMLNPYVNSYKRIDPEMFTPAAASWGSDDRSTACRAIIDDLPGARVEHRRPGADASPYLVAAGILAAGLHGLREKIALQAPREHVGSVPADLRGAVTAFDESTWLPEMLGKPFCESYAATRRAEADRFDTWLRQTITTWELTRHLEHQ